MSAIKATWTNGQIVPAEPVAWPEGCVLRVEPATDDQADPFDNDNQHDDPASIARWIAAFDAIPPLRMTPEEEAAWQKARLTQKEQEKATFASRAQALGSILE